MVQPPRKVPITMTGECRLQNHTEGSAPAKGTWRLKRTALRREQLGNSSTRPNPQGMKAVHHRNQKLKCWKQHMEVPFMKVITKVIGTYNQGRRNGNMP
jgi:hypothetical protein